VDVRRLVIGIAVILPVLLLAACGGGARKTARSTIPPQTTTHAPAPSSISTTTAGPRAFQAQSVTFVSTQLGWVLGTTTCLGDPSCNPILLRTEDAGRAWTRIPLPPDSTVDQVRFADPADGWVWNNQSVPPYVLHLWSTHDGGLEWQRPQLPGAAPGGASDLEAAAGLVSATVWSATGDPLIETSSVQIDNWRPSSVTLPVGAGGGPSEQIVLTGTFGWLIDEDRGVLGGARLVDGAWVPWTPPCSRSGGAAVLAASDPTHLVAVCEEGMFAGPQLFRAYFSSDGGSTFQPAAPSLSLEPPSTLGPIASPAPGVVVMGPGDFAGGSDLIGRFDGAATWKVLYHQSTPAAWRYEPAWDPRRLYTLEARMEPWTRSGRHRRGIRLS